MRTRRPTPVTVSVGEPSQRDQPVARFELDGTTTATTLALGTVNYFTQLAWTGSEARLFWDQYYIALESAASSPARCADGSLISAGVHLRRRVGPFAVQPLTRTQLLDLVRRHGIPESAFCFGVPSAGTHGVISLEQENGTRRSRRTSSSIPGVLRFVVSSHDPAKGSESLRDLGELLEHDQASAERLSRCLP
jgi:hypothetical protein